MGATTSSRSHAACSQRAQSDHAQAANGLQATILSVLRKRNGGMVAGEGAPARWHLVGLDDERAAD